MPKPTKRGKFLGAAVCAVAIALVMALLTAALLAACFLDVNGAETILVLICAAVYLSVAIGVLAALRQRWKELQGGEEDEAKKY